MTKNNKFYLKCAIFTWPIFLLLHLTLGAPLVAAIIVTTIAEVITFAMFYFLQPGPYHRDER